MDHTLTHFNLVPSQFPFIEKSKKSVGEAIGGATSEEPVLVQRQVQQARCDTSSLHVSPPDTMDSKLTPVKVKIASAKKMKVTRRPSFASPKMKRIFNVFKSAKCSTTKMILRNRKHKK